METQERSPEFWRAEAVRARTSAGQMKNPLAKKGLEHIAACYDGFARKPKNGLAKNSLRSLRRPTFCDAPNAGLFFAAAGRPD